MLIEVKTKTKRTIDNKTKTYSETYLVDKELFAEAEYAVMQHLSAAEGGIVSYEIGGLKLSPIKELYHVGEGENTYISTLIDSFTDDKGNVKTNKYKVLLWADSIAEANTRSQAFAREGYDMKVEGLTEKEITYLR